MSEVINLLLGSIIAIFCTYWLMYSARMVAILILLIQRGQSTIAKLETVYTHKVSVSRRYYYVYQYTVDDKDYTIVEVITGTLSNRILNKPTEQAIIYVSSHPILSGRYYERPFLALMTFPFVAAGFFCATIIGLLPFINSMVIYGIWLLLVIGMIAFPCLAANKIIRRYFEPNIPQNAVWQETP